MNRSRKWIGAIQSVAPLIVLAALFLGFSLADSHFATRENLQAIIEGGAVSLVLAAGATFVILLGSLDLSIEGVMGASAMTVVLLVKNSVNANDFGWAGVLMALLIGVIFGCINGLLNVYVKLPSIIVTIGTWFVGLGYAYIVFPSHQPGLLYQPLIDIVLTRKLGLSLLVYVAGGILLVAHIICRYTELGRMIYAIGGDETTAIASGVPVGRYRIGAFAISGGLFALGGVMAAAQLENGTPTAGHDMLFSTLGAAVVGGTQLSGGRGGPLHSAAGVFILAVLANGMVQLGAGPYTRNIIIGAMIVTAVASSNWHLRRKLRVVK